MGQWLGYETQQIKGKDLQAGMYLLYRLQWHLVRYYDIRWGEVGLTLSGPDYHMEHAKALRPDMTVTVRGVKL